MEYKGNSFSKNISTSLRNVSINFLLNKLFADFLLIFMPPTHTFISNDPNDRVKQVLHLHAMVEVNSEYYVRIRYKKKYLLPRLFNINMEICFVRIEDEILEINRISYAHDKITIAEKI